MERIEVLYLVRSSESGGYIHISEKETLDDSDAMDAKFVLAFNQQDALQCLLKNKTKLSISAINKNEELSLDVVLLPSNDEDIDAILCTVNTPYGYCWFKLKHFNNYVGRQLKDMKIFDMEPLSDTQLEQLCLEHQFFFIGS